MGSISKPVSSGLLLLAAVVLAGCITDGGGGAKVNGPLRWKLMSEDGDHYLGVSTKTPNAYGYLLVKRELHPPFRWEVTVAPREDTGLGDVGWIATELDAPGTVPLQFWLMGAEPAAGGTNVFASCHLDLSRQGETLIAGATSVDLAIEHDGDDVVFYARATGGGGYTEIWRRDATGQQMPVQPAVGVVGLAPGALVGFDDFRVAANGWPTGKITPGYEILCNVQDVVDDLVDAMHASDGATPDIPGALEAVDSAIAALGDAIDDLDALVQGKVKTGPTAAQKLLGKAKKAAESVRGKLDKGKAGKSAIKGLMKAALSALNATEALR